jgi:hypothetical protein
MAISEKLRRLALKAFRTEDLFDGIVARLGFDPAHPDWTPQLRRLHTHSRKQRLQVIPDFFYTPVFSPATLPPGVWEGSFPDCGSFDLEAQRAFLQETPTFQKELEALPSAPHTPRDASFYWGNEQFGHADAALYYCLIRRFRPGRIVEVGAGYSTTLALQAIQANGTGSVLCIDPHPPASLQSWKELIEIRTQPVQEAPDSLFLELRPSDILFIDGSHITKMGSDVNHLFLRVLPKLPKGVLVHIHDICLPFDYPRTWSEDSLCYWNEQYVLAGLLANSTKFRVLVGVYFLQKTDPDALVPLLPKFPGVFPGGGSLWMQSME